MAAVAVAGRRAAKDRRWEPRSSETLSTRFLPTSARCERSADPSVDPVPQNVAVRDRQGRRLSTGIHHSSASLSQAREAPTERLTTSLRHGCPSTASAAIFRRADEEETGQFSTRLFPLYPRERRKGAWAPRAADPSLASPSASHALNGEALECLPVLSRPCRSGRCAVPGGCMKLRWRVMGRVGMGRDGDEMGMGSGWEYSTYRVRSQSACRFSETASGATDECPPLLLKVLTHVAGPRPSVHARRSQRERVALARSQKRQRTPYLYGTRPPHADDVVLVAPGLLSRCLRCRTARGGACALESKNVAGRGIGEHFDGIETHCCVSPCFVKKSTTR